MTSDLELFNAGYKDAGSITQALQLASESAHLVSPATACDILPDGFSVSLCTVLVDIDRETYPTLSKDDDESGGRNGDPNEKRALGKTALERIAMAAGVSWDPNRSGRLDNGRDPHYARYRAVGTVRQFDGQLITLVDEREIDLREGCAQVALIREKARMRALWQKKPNDGGAKQIQELRQHILSHAISKARLRAIRTLGLRSWYTRKELGLPFVIAKIMATGQSDDPVLRREFGRMILGNALDSNRSLYGEPSAKAPQLTAYHDPPPIEATGVEEDVAGAPVPASVPPPSASPEPAKAKTPSTPPTKTYPQQTGAPPPGVTSATGAPAPVSSASTPSETGGGSAYQKTADVQPSGFRVPGNKGEGGKPIEAASDETLRWWIGRISGNLASGTANPRFAENDRRILAAMEREMAIRSNPGEPTLNSQEQPEDDLPF
jgi:hypothetical protein